MKIWAHTLVKNEERYLWFAVKSVINYVDKVFLWDTGSTDKTVKIIKLLKKDYPGKIDFREVGDVNIDRFTKVRQKMLEKSSCDWVMILDGDEVWWEKSIKNVREIIEKRGKNLDTLVHRYYNVIGDIYHFQEEKAGRYKIDGQTGHLTIRFFNRKIPQIRYAKPHGTQGIFDGKDILIQERDTKRRFHTNDYYLHFTNMIRSSKIELDKKVIKRSFKYKYELGEKFSKDFKYPKVLFQKKPEIVPSPWEKRDLHYLLRASLLTPLKKLKRRVKNEKVGY